MLNAFSIETKKSEIGSKLQKVSFLHNLKLKNGRHFANMQFFVKSDRLKAI